MIKYILIFILSLLINKLFAFDSIDDIMVDSFFKKNLNCKGFSFHKECSFLNLFYLSHNNKTIWVDSNGLKPNAIIILEEIKKSYLDGIDPNLFNLSGITDLLSNFNQEKIDYVKRNDILQQLDILITDTVYNYERYLYYGVLNYEKIFPYWKNIKQKLDMVSIIDKTINQPQETILYLTPKYKDYSVLKQKLVDLRKIIESKMELPSIKWENTYTLGTKNTQIKLLQKKLVLSGELSTNKINGVFDDKTKGAILVFQQNNGLSENGNIDDDTLNALNLSISSQIKKIELNMDIMRLFPDNLEDDYILVNLPEFNLDIIENNKVILSMDIAVGGKDHPSCILNSSINSLILNPYWYIPYNIAFNEIWNVLKKNANYIQDKQIDVLKLNKKNYYILDNDTSKIDWNKILVDEFNLYKFRQRPSNINALGKVKFIFDNSCGVFLHSTNEPTLFEAYQRAFSHGCIRVSQPLNLTTFVLLKQNQWNITQINDLFNNTVDKKIILTKQIKIYFVYLTVFKVNNNFIQYRKDIYNFEDNLFKNFP